MRYKQLGKSDLKNEVFKYETEKLTAITARTINTVHLLNLKDVYIDLEFGNSLQLLLKKNAATEKERK